MNTLNHFGIQKRFIREDTKSYNNEDFCPYCKQKAPTKETTEFGQICRTCLASKFEKVNAARNEWHGTRM
jgi:predicted amidophosphoribosyltransferase